MLGYNHVASGALAGVATLPLVALPDTRTQIAWVATCAGAALLPDVDTPHSAASTMWGPFSGAAATLVGALTGGHRHGTHDLLLAPAGAAVIAWGCSLTTAPFVALLAVCVGLGLRGLLLVRGGLGVAVGNLAVSAAAAWWLAGSVYVAQAKLLVPAALVVGVVTHCAGDLFTPEGVPVPVWWICRREARLAVPLFDTGGLIERRLIAPLLSVALLVGVGSRISQYPLAEMVQASEALLRWG